MEFAELEAQAEVDAILEAVGDLESRFRPHITSGLNARARSLAASELRSVNHNAALVQILGALPERAREAMNVCSDAALTISRALRFSASEGLHQAKYAPAGIARDALEASALVRWLLATDIDVEERGRRTIALIRKDFEEERKFCEANQRDHPQFQPDMAAAVEWIQEECEKVETLANATGLSPLGLPGGTELTLQAEGAAFDYKLFSALAHGRPWALTAVRKMYGASYGVAGELWLYFVHSVVEYCSRAVWSFVAHMNPDGRPALKETLERLYDDCRMKEEPRAFFR